jgi:hypothetical protein
MCGALHTDTWAAATASRLAVTAPVDGPGTKRPAKRTPPGGRKLGCTLRRCQPGLPQRASGPQTSADGRAVSSADGRGRVLSRRPGP